MVSRFSDWRGPEEGQAWQRKQKRLEIFVFTPLRIILFPIALLVRVYKWVYHYNG